jgi:hypothetical protein
MTRAARLLVVVCMVCAGMPARAAAEDPKEMFERGMALYALGKYAEAAPLFERAFELKPDPALLYNAAQAHRFMGEKARALELYQSYLRLYGNRIPNHDEVVRLVEQLKQAIASEQQAATSPPVGTQPPEQTPAVVAPAPVFTPAPVAIQVSAPDKKPLTRRAWFWGVVGGGAALVLTGVIVGVVVGTRGHADPAATFGTVNGN